MTHVRTIKEAAAYFKERDPGTCLTETAIRTLIRKGEIPYTSVGKKYLVTIEALEEFLRGKQPAGEETAAKLPKQKTVWHIA